MYRPNRIGPSAFIDVGSPDTQIVNANIVSALAGNGNAANFPAGLHSAVLPENFNSQCYFSNGTNLPITVFKSFAFGIALSGLPDISELPFNPYHLTVSGSLALQINNTMDGASEFFSVFPVIGALPPVPVAMDGSTDSSDFNTITRWQILPGTHNFVQTLSGQQMQGSFNEDIVLGDFGLSSTFTSNAIFVGWLFHVLKASEVVGIISSLHVSAFKYLSDLETFDPTR